MKFREGFLLYLRDIDRFTERVIGSYNRWDIAETYGRSETDGGKKATSTAVKMIQMEHPIGEILGIGE